MNKYLFFFLFFLCGLLYGQQHKFGFWHAAWSGTPDLPSTFAITDDGSGFINVFANGFSSTPIAYDSCLVLLKQGSLPSSRYDGTAISNYYNAPTILDEAINASALDGEIWYGALYLRSTDGKWSSPITDTAYIGIPEELSTPTLLLSAGSGTITVNAGSLDPNATHVLIQQRSFQNHTSIWRDGSRFRDTLIAVGNLPVTFTGKYYDEVWHYKMAAVNPGDTSGFTPIDSSWAVNTVGDTIWYAASATGNGSGSDTLNCKLYSVTNFQNDVYANVSGRHIKLKNVDTFASSSRILLPYTQSWSGRSYAPVVVEPWYDNGILPVVDRTTSGEIIYVERGNHIIFRNIHFAGHVTFNVPSTYHADNFRFINCEFIGTGSGASGMIAMFLQETNVVAYDSVNRGFADSFYVYNCLFQNIYSSDDAIGSSSGGIDWVIYRNVVANTGSALGQDGIDVGYGLRVIIAYCKIYNTWNNGIKIMAQRGPNHDALVCYNSVIGNNMSGDGNFAFDIRTCVGIRFMNNSGTGFGYGLPAETSWPDNTHSGALNDNSTYPVIAFQGLGNNIFNNLYVGGSGNGFSGWIIHGGKNIMFTYPGGDTTRATWGPGRDDWGRWYLNYSSWHHNLYNNPAGGDKARYIARHWPLTGNGSITWNGSSYDLSIGSQSWIERDMEEFGTGYEDKFFSNIFLPAQVVDSSYNNDGDRGSLQPVEGSPALYAGTFNGMAVDLNWMPVPDTLVSIGAYQECSGCITPDYRYTVSPYPFAFGTMDTTAASDTVKVLTITNTGLLPLTITFSGLNTPFSIGSGGTINNNELINVNITGERNMSPGTYIDTLLISTNDYDTTVIVSITLTLPSPPAILSGTFTAQQANDSLKVQLSGFNNPDSIRIVGQTGSYPANQWSGTVVYAGTDTNAVNNDVFYNSDFDNGETWYFAAYQQWANGQWSPAVTDTALFGTAPVVGDIFNITFESNSMTGSDAFTSVTATTNTFTVVSDTVAVGTYSAKIDPTGSSSAVVYGTKIFTSSGSIYIKWKEWLGHPATGDYEAAPWFRIDDGAGSDLISVSIRRGTFEPGGYDFQFSGTNLDGGEYDLGTGSLTIANTFGQYVECEARWIDHATTGGAVVIINGVTVFSELNKNTSALNNPARFQIGFGNNSNGNGGNLPNVNSYVDDIKANSTAFP
ncbi:MAG: hypothetical protein IPM56_16260 [Ignavibacteriales bacterium]|nr:MAG: hypothetical protein IPM56_16260 [Ignavibacteriales bacterium]